MEFTEKSYPEATSKNNKSVVFHSVKLPLFLEESPPSPSPHSSRLPSPQIPSFCFRRARTPPPKPLLDLEDVRTFIRSKFGSTKEGNGHSAAKRVPFGVFGIGTMGSTGSDGGYVHLSSSQANEHQGQISSHPPTHTHTLYHHHGCPQCAQSSNGCSYHHYEHTPDHQHAQLPYPILDIDDVRDAIDSFLHLTGFRRHPTTSWRNKMPWHVPRAPFLAKGLEWPPDSFESEEARRAYYRKARKRKPFLLGSPPLWTVTALNLAFIQLLMYNPLQKFFDYLRTLP